MIGIYSKTVSSKQYTIFKYRPFIFQMVDFNDSSL